MYIHVHFLIFICLYNRLIHHDKLILGLETVWNLEKLSKLKCTMWHFLWGFTEGCLGRRNIISSSSLPGGKTVFKTGHENRKKEKTMDVEVNTKWAALPYGFLEGSMCQVNLVSVQINSDENICKEGVVGEQRRACRGYQRRLKELGMLSLVNQRLRCSFCL